MRTTTGEKLDIVIAYTIMQNYLDVYKDATNLHYKGDISVADLMGVLDISYCRWDKVYTLSKQSVIDYFRMTYNSPDWHENQQAARKSTFGDYARYMRGRAITSAFGV